jgi:3-oxoacyl-[acyl-carrier protein] reductase
MSGSGRLEGKTALVTGAASGFGRGMAERFAAEGAKVGVLDRNGEGAREVAAGLPGAIAIECDVTSAVEVNAAASRMKAAFSRIDILVNNAGWSHPNQPMLEVDEESFDRVYAVNVKSIYLTARAVVPLMRSAGGGAIVNIGSTAGARPRPGLTWYNSTKGAVNTMTKSMAAELAPDRIRVNAIAPVLGATGLMETFIGGPDTPEKRAKFLATIPLGRLSTPADIAAAALFLSSDEANFVTGVILEVDGGRCI